MAVDSTAGTSIGITLTAPATFDQTGYDAGTYTKIGEVTNMGEFGPEYSEITHAPIDTNVVQKFKGGVNMGTLALTLAIDRADAGQLIARSALASKLDAYFEIIWPDATRTWLPAKVMSFKTNPGGSDQILAGSINLSISASKAGVGIIDEVVDEG